MPEKRVRFAEFELDFGRFQLSRGGNPVRLEGLPLQLLMYLVEHHRQLVTREQIASELWGKDVFVDIEQGINTAVRKIRIALEDDSAQPQYLQTVVGRGYRFVPDIRVEGEANVANVASADGTQAFKISAEEFGKALMAAAGLDDPKTPPKVPNNS
jgi:DNA-binding winged helix-turn-helix (wHTH) protein